MNISLDSLESPSAGKKVVEGLEVRHHAVAIQFTQSALQVIMHLGEYFTTEAVTHLKRV